MIDATEGVGETDSKIANLILEKNKACLIAVNKWDLVENREEAVRVFRSQLEQKIGFLWWSEIIFISAKTGQRTERILEEAEKIYEQYSRFLKDDELKEFQNELLNDKPFSRKGTVLRLKSMLLLCRCVTLLACLRFFDHGPNCTRGDLNEPMPYLVPYLGLGRRFLGDNHSYLACLQVDLLNAEREA